MPDPSNELMARLAARGKLAGSGNGGDDGGTMLETRVAALEADMREVKGSLGRIEGVLAKIEARFDRFDDRLKRVETDVAEGSKRLQKVEVDLARVDGRLQNVPTTWTFAMAILGTVLSVTGLTLAIVRFGLPG